MNQSAQADPQAANHLAEFGQLIGIPKLQLDTAGCCQLTFDGHWLVTLMYSAKVRQWILSCFLAAGGATISTEAQSAMLRANFMGYGCAGGCLSVTPDGRPSLEFHLSVEEASGNALLATIEKLLDQTEIWSERIQRNETPPATSTRPHEWILGRV
jgi:hypothetical protein